MVVEVLSQKKLPIGERQGGGVIKLGGGHNLQHSAAGIMIAGRAPVVSRPRPLVCWLGKQSSSCAHRIFLVSGEPL